MIEINEEEAKKLGASILTDINGGRYALYQTHLFIINPRYTVYEKQQDDDKAVNI